MSDLPYAGKTVSGAVGELANLTERVEERPLSTLCPGVSVYPGSAPPAPRAWLLASCFSHCFISVGISRRAYPTDVELKHSKSGVIHLDPQGWMHTSLWFWCQSRVKEGLSIWRVQKVAKADTGLDTR